MTTSPDDHDDELLAELAGAVAGSDPPGGPDADRMREAARAAFTWRTVDAELALLLLTHDSADDRSVAVVRATDEPPRTLTLAADGVRLELEIGSSVIIGQLAPATDGTVTITAPDGTTVESTVDELGFVRLDRPPGGPVKIVCRTDEGAAATGWITL